MSAAAGPDRRRRFDAVDETVEAREVHDPALVQLLGDGRAPIAASQSSEDDRGPRASTTRSAGSSPAAPPTCRTTAPVTSGTDPAFARRPSAATPWRSSTPGCASTRRRNTHSNVVRRHAIATSSSSPGHCVWSVSVSGRFAVNGISVAPAASSASSTSGARSRKQVAQPREERVRVAHLRRAAPVPLERGVGRLRHRRVVALEHRDPCPSRADASAVPSPAMPPPTTTMCIPHGNVPWGRPVSDDPRLRWPVREGVGTATRAAHAIPSGICSVPPYPAGRRSGGAKYVPKITSQIGNTLAKFLLLASTSLA